MNGSGTSRVGGKCVINVLVFLVAVEFSHIQGHRQKSVKGLGSSVVGQFGRKVGASNGQFERCVLDAKAYEPGFELIRGISVEAGARFPVDTGVGVLQFGLRVANTGGSGSAEGNDDLSAEVVGVQEGKDYAGKFTVPDGEAQEHNIVVGAGKGSVDGRTNRCGAILLLISAGGRVVIVAVVAGIGFRGSDLVSVGSEDIGHRFCDGFGGVGEGEVGYQNFLRA